jgi:hypothetical protein
MSEQQLADGKVNGHDARGRFTAGNKGNPNSKGRPRKSAEHEYVTALLGACSVAKWRAICRKAVGQALAGDAKARAFLAHYLYGPTAGGFAERVDFKNDTEWERVWEAGDDEDDDDDEDTDYFESEAAAHEYDQLVERLGRRWGTEGIPDTVLEALRRCAAAGGVR